MSLDLSHIIATAQALFPDVVWGFLGYMAALDGLKYLRHFREALKANGGLVSKTGLAKALASLVDPQFFVQTVVDDVTAQHAGKLALTGFLIGLSSGQGLKVAAMGAILGAATASVADARETFWASFKQAFGSLA